MNADDNPDVDGPQPADLAASSESERLGLAGTAAALGDQLKPQSPIENLKSNVPMPGDSLLTKVMKIITSWT